MERLIEELKEKVEILNNTYGYQENLNGLLDALDFVQPFNKVEYIIAKLMSCNILDFDEYERIRKSFFERNKYIKLFEITAPRTFGETWAQKHLNEILPELCKPSKNYDCNYSNGSYDFWYDGIRIEVKASRAVKKNSNGLPLVTKALYSNSLSKFEMNFQQIKPDCCDVFVWIAVWLDKIKYWVLSSDDVRNNRYYSNGQHRGNEGEGQLMMKDSNIAEFTEYEVLPQNILQKIIEKGKNL